MYKHTHLRYPSTLVTIVLRSPACSVDERVSTPRRRVDSRPGAAVAIRIINAYVNGEIGSFGLILANTEIPRCRVHVLRIEREIECEICHG